MKIIKVNLQDNPYNIYVGDNLIQKIPFYIKSLNLGNFGIIVTSQKIHSLYKDVIKNTFKDSAYRIVKVIDGERAKSKEWAFKVIGEILRCDGWNKKLFIICFGGGTIGDLGGFVASLYKRGLPYIQVPTTLLSQIDASIGGKTGIDLKEAKNILGTFYQPKAVFIDPIFLDTLASRAIKEGIAEAIKYGVIKRKSLFYFLKSNHKEILTLKRPHILRLITNCAQIKAKIVAVDEKEGKGIRTILNFGHTLAHALEASLCYRRISHGEAVSLGMRYAAELSLLLGKCKKRDVEEIIKVIDLFSLPHRISFDCPTLYKALSYDKKFISGKIRMVLLKKIGEVEVVEGISLKRIRESLKHFSALI